MLSAEHGILDLDDVISMHQGALALSSDIHRSNTLSNLALALHNRFLSTGLLPDLENSVSLLREALSLRPASHSDRLSALLDLSTVLSTRWQQLGRLPDLTDPISFLREALELMRDDHPRRPAALTDLAIALQNRHKWQGGESDRDLFEAISLHREALSLRSGSHSERRSSLASLGLALRAQSMLEHETPQSLTHAGLNEAVSLLRESLALTLSAAPTDYSSSLKSLALTLQTRFARMHDSHDLDEAVTLYQRAVALLSEKHRDRAAVLTGLVVALHTRYEQTHQQEDLAQAISLHHQAFMLRPQRRPNRSYAFTVLEPVLRTRFQINKRIPVLLETDNPLLDVSSAAGIPELNALEQIDAAITGHREALGSHTADRARNLSSLGLALHTRFINQADKYIDKSALEEAISLLQEALDLRQEPHPDRPSSLQNLALAFYTLHMHSLNMPGMYFLDDVVSLLREALVLQPYGHFGRSFSLDSLAVALHTRFEHGGQPLDLDEAILLHREALSLRPASHPDRSSSLANLAIVLHTRSEHMDQIWDLDAAIALHYEALTLRTGTHPERKHSCHRLALAFHSHFQQTGRLSDLDKAIAFFRDALALLSASDSGRPSVLNNLAISLRARYKVTYHLQYLDRSIDLHREALALLPEYDYGGISCFTSLAAALYLRAEETGRLTDLDEAIDISQKTLQGFHRHDRDNPIRCPVLEALGSALLARFLRADEAGNNLNDCHMALDSFQAIEWTASTPLSQRFPAVRMLARVSDALDDGHGLALQAYRSTIDLLPFLAGVGVDLESRQRALMLDTDGVAREAAACAIRQQKYEQAIELLESGRAVFWSQALQLRAPVDRLGAVKPELAHKLRDISRSLESGALRDISRTVSESEEKAISSETQAVRYRQLNVEWEEVIEQIRRLDGFGDFLKPKSFATLSAAANNGPVVILNASSFRSECDALVLTVSHAPIHIPLKTLTYRMAERLARRMHVLLGVSFQNRGTTRYIVAKDADSEFRKLLVIFWKSIVQLVLHALNLKKSESPPRLWWLPTGPFVSLPLHAAGIYDGPESEFVGDYVVSSYIPTLNALLTPLPVPPTPESFKMLAIIQPITPRQLPLKYTKEELRSIESHIPSPTLISYGVPGRPAHVQDVLSDLPAASMVHFACHGVQNAGNPLKSALLLEEPLTVSQLMELEMPNASLVFLSACQTATGDRQLPDEAMHLAATLLFTGFRGAVGTMWSIRDEDGPKVADHFYQYLTTSVEGDPSSRSRNGVPSCTRAAYALQFAVNKLRAEGCSFVHWVPFIHLGL